MPEFAHLFKILNTYGPWGLLLIVVVYIILKGEINFRYPRNANRKSKRVE
jgi:hypothetical protein